MRKSILLLLIILIPVMAIAQTANDFFDKAINEFHKGNYKEAIANFQKCIQLEPVDAIEAEAYANIAALNNLDGKYKQAINNSNKSIEINPSNIRAYVERGAANLAQGNKEIAITDFSVAINLDKKNIFLSSRIRAFVHRGVARAGLGDFNGAIQDYDAAIALGSNDTRNPEIMKGYMARGISKIRIGQIESGCSDILMAGKLGSKEAYEFANKLSHKYGINCSKD
jgi:tetratricopeptide (TPR) repeat protein